MRNGRYRNLGCEQNERVEFPKEADFNAMLNQHRNAIYLLRKRRDVSRQGWFKSLRIRTICFVAVSILIGVAASFVNTHVLNDNFIQSTLKQVYSVDYNLVHVFRSLAGDDQATDDPAAAADDGHGDDGHAFSLFGAISYLKIYQGTLSVLIIVVAVLTVEYAFHMLNVITHDTPFNQMVQSIEKELMAVGFTAFAFKIMVDTTHFLDLDWFHALEYAGKSLIIRSAFAFWLCRET